MSSSSKIVPALGLGGRFWRLQKEVGQQVAGFSTKSMSTSAPVAFGSSQAFKKSAGSSSSAWNSSSSSSSSTKKLSEKSGF
jgi:hypothetical protein